MGIFRRIAKAVHPGFALNYKAGGAILGTDQIERERKANAQLAAVENAIRTQQAQREKNKQVRESVAAAAFSTASAAAIGVGGSPAIDARAASFNEATANIGLINDSLFGGNVLSGARQNAYNASQPTNFELLSRKGFEIGLSTFLK
jgi:hypothetical protein